MSAKVQVDDMTSGFRTSASLNVLVANGPRAITGTGSTVDVRAGQPVDASVRS